MSSDDPTRRLPPANPVAYGDAEELLFREDVRDRLRSLTTIVVMLAVLAVAALGIAIWALLDGQDSGDTQAASASQVVLSSFDFASTCSLSARTRSGTSRISTFRLPIQQFARITHPPSGWRRTP